MTNERWRTLMGEEFDADAYLTDDEIAEGWHYCYPDWDGLLIGPRMKRARSLHLFRY